jgi:hypothetical protein
VGHGFKIPLRRFKRIINAELVSAFYHNFFQKLDSFALGKGYPEGSSYLEYFGVPVFIISNIGPYQYPHKNFIRLVVAQLLHALKYDPNVENILHLGRLALLFQNFQSFRTPSPLESVWQRWARVATTYPSRNLSDSFREEVARSVSDVPL